MAIDGGVVKQRTTCIVHQTRRRRRASSQRATTLGFSSDFIEKLSPQSATVLFNFESINHLEQLLLHSFGKSTYFQTPFFCSSVLPLTTSSPAPLLENFSSINVFTNSGLKALTHFSQMTLLSNPLLQHSRNADFNNMFCSSVFGSKR